MMDYASIRAFREALTAARYLGDLKQICKKFCDAVGVEFYLFGVCEAVSLTAPKIITLTNFPAEWVDSYFQDRLAASDPILKYSLSHSTPILWSELENLSGFNSVSDKAFMDMGRKAGLRHGLTVPLNPPSGQTSFFSLASADALFDENRLGNLLAGAGMFSTYLLDAYIRIDKIENPKANELTKRELECVFWACEGKTAWEMAHIVGVSERTINFHLTSVIKKLGASNRQHAVAKAVMYGLVKLRPQ
jgi:LuxR family transcriptional activator of bioluminescence operon